MRRPNRRRGRCSPIWLFGKDEDGPLHVDRRSYAVNRTASVPAMRARRDGGRDVDPVWRVIGQQSADGPERMCRPRDDGHRNNKQVK